MSNSKPDFVLSLDFAKRLAMMARTQRGEQIRAYFIECEKMALEASRPRTQIDVLLESVQALHAQERKLSAVETRVQIFIPFKKGPQSNQAALLTFFKRDPFYFHFHPNVTHG